MNVVDSFYESFILNVMPVLQEQNYGIMAMKTLGGGGLLGTNSSSEEVDPEKLRVIPEKLSVKEAHHFAWSLPVSTIISGMLTLENLEMNVASAKSFVKMTEEQRSELIGRVADVSTTGEMERYKLRW